MLCVLCGNVNDGTHCSQCAGVMQGTVMKSSVCHAEQCSHMN